MSDELDDFTAQLNSAEGALPAAAKSGAGAPAQPGAEGAGQFTPE